MEDLTYKEIFDLTQKAGRVKSNLCKYPNAQFTITYWKWAAHFQYWNGTITGSEKSHFWYCVYRSFFFFVF